MSFKTRLFTILWLAGFAGVLSILWIDLNALVAILSLPAGTEVPAITPTLKFLGLVQPAIILSVAVLIGVSLAPKVRLSAPVAEAAASGGDFVSALKPQVVPGIVGGCIGGVAIVLTSLLWKPLLSPEAVTRISRLGNLLPVPTRFLYGGILEELLLRWGLMTLLVWAIWRLFQKGQKTPKPVHFIAAIFASSVIFGIGHLPIAYLLVPEASLALTLFVIAGNSLFGLVAGYLYWKKGLESAVVAHMLAHVVLLTASYLGAYF